MESDEYTELISRRWTAAELIEFLDIGVEDIIERFRREIERNLGSILDEIGYSIEDDEAEL